MRVYHFDPKACADLAQLPPVGIHPGMPFVLDDHGHPAAELNCWLRSLPTTRVPAPNSWNAYAADLVAWLRFLRQRNVGLVDEVATLRNVSPPTTLIDGWAISVAASPLPAGTGPSPPSPGFTTGPKPRS